MSHYLYLVRHGEQQDAEFGVPEGPLSDRGRAQAHAIGKRLARVPFDEVFTSPLDRCVETAAIMSAHTQGPVAEPSNLLFDCIPSGNDGAPASYDTFFSGIDTAVIEAGTAQIHDACETWFTRSRSDEHTLLVTHNFVVGALVAVAMDMPEWRWLTLRGGHTALTVLRVRSIRPTELTLFGDNSHLPPELRTGTSGTAWF